MIVTLTPNPSIDRAIGHRCPASSAARSNRATSSRIDPGGKGVNVSRALTPNGTAVRRGPARPVARRVTSWRSCSTRPGVAPRAVSRARGTLRMNISVLEPDGTTTKLNEPGPQLDARRGRRPPRGDVGCRGRRPGSSGAAASRPVRRPDVAMPTSSTSLLRERSACEGRHRLLRRADARSRSPLGSETSSSPTTRSSRNSSVAILADPGRRPRRRQGPCRARASRPSRQPRRRRCGPRDRR
jgi:hypothetical protein